MATKLPLKMLIVTLVTMVKPQDAASAFHTSYDSLMSDKRSLATQDLPTTRYGDLMFHYCLKSSQKSCVLKEYACTNPTTENSFR